MEDISSITPKLVIQITPGNATSQVEAAIIQARNYVNSSGGLAIIYFRQGTYDFTDTIELTHNEKNIVFQGEGSDKTILCFNDMKNSHCFNITGTFSGWSSSNDLDQNFNKGDSILHAATDAGLSTLAVDNWVHFVQYDFDYEDPISDIIPDAVGQISQIEAKGIDATGEWAEIKDVANRNYVDPADPDYSLKIRKMTPASNIGIEDLMIYRSPNAEATEYAYNIRFNCAINCWVRGVESYRPSRSHLSVSRSSHLEISGCYFHEAEGYGGDGWGYGVVLESSTTNCLVENNIFRYLRHALVAGAGSNCNVWAFNYSREQYAPISEPTNRDLDLHAKYPFGHLFEHNVIQRIGSDDAHGKNGPYNAFFRNYCKGAAYLTEAGVDIKDMTLWATLGNVGQHFPTLGATLHHWDNSNSSPSTDIFGFLNDYTISYPHNSFYWSLDEGPARLQDISYYYSNRPSFLPSTYTWPALGTKVSAANLTQSIPAEARWGDSKKTYLLNPTPKPLTTAGTLPYSQTWSGTHNCTDDVTVPAGITLTIDPGATITFPDNKKLLVYGALNAVGSGSSGIEFDCSDAGETWYGVTFESGSSGELQYCTIRNASYGAYVKECAPSITHCTFVDNNKAFRVYMGMDMNSPFADNTILGGYYGIYLYDPYRCSIENCTIDNAVYGVRTNTVDDWTEFTGNNIKNCDAEGVRLYKSNPIFYDNNIYSNDDEGIYMYTDSEPYLFDSMGGNNVVAYNGTWGIYIKSGCRPILGSAYAENDEGNSYYSNGIGELYSLSSHAVDARKSWWGQAFSDTTLLRINGNFYCNPILSSDPNETPPGLSKSSVADAVEGTSESLQTISVVDSVAWRLFAQAHALQVQKKYDQAIPLYQQIIDEHVQTPEAEMAVVRLARCYKRTEQKSQGKQEIIALSDSKASDAVALAAELEAAEWELQDGNVDQAIAHYEGVVRARKSRSQQALYDLWAVHFHITGNKGQQTALLKQYEDWYGEDENVIDMKLAMGLISGKEARKWAEEHADDKELGKGGAASTESALPKQFALHANYPNPFNPTTRIAYDLPEASVVRLEIYNVLGQRAALLLDERRESGRHLALWDGRTASGAKAAAGLYFCRMTAGEFARTIKMTLLP